MGELKADEKRVEWLVGLLGRAALAAAVLCVLALVAGRFAQSSAQAVPIEPVNASASTVGTMSLPVVAYPTAEPSPTAGVSEVDTDGSASPTRIGTVSPTVVATSHIVCEGETLILIAWIYGVSVEDLVLVNELEDPDLIYVGQRLTLPGSSMAPPAPQASPTAPAAESTPIPSLASPDAILNGRWIDVDISDQRLTAYEEAEPVRTSLVSTGLPHTPTPLGEFNIWIKLRYDDMAGADYYIEDVPYVMYFHEGYGLHGVTWHGNFGHPMSHGCVNLPTEEAAWLFEWADVGTLVRIHQ